eukprot:gb/GEZN01019808.1/.p1 GENE.gb/GEZN01019808.1/~~gb/GEZN01019808.1/.p1  ORF type:complete len:118 (-),score=14.14 gb/GEZN01019808.1/:241-594(-)
MPEVQSLLLRGHLRNSTTRTRRHYSCGEMPRVQPWLPAPCLKEAQNNTANSNAMSSNNNNHNYSHQLHEPQKLLRTISDRLRLVVVSPNHPPHPTHSTPPSSSSSHCHLPPSHSLPP